jgi:hypothetical protein
MRAAPLACILLVAAPLCLTACGGEDSAEHGTSATGQAESSHYEGGEESVEEFGSEASGSERDAILGAEQGYLAALAGKDFASACSYLSGQARRSLSQLLTPAAKGKGCAATLPALLSSSAPATASQQAGGKITKVRVQGDRAFVLFGAPGAKLYVFTLGREGGEWKATTIAASILVPAAGTVGTP